MAERGVREPWFSLIAVGAKRFEGRLGNNASFGAMPPGTRITWVNSELGFKRTCETEVVAVTRHKSFRAMFKAVGLANALPTVDKAADGEAVYRAFYSAADEAEHGVLCAELRVAPGASAQSREMTVYQCKSRRAAPRG